MSTLAFDPVESYQVEDPDCDLEAMSPLQFNAFTNLEDEFLDLKTIKLTDFDDNIPVQNTNEKENILQVPEFINSKSQAPDSIFLSKQEESQSDFETKNSTIFEDSNSDKNGIDFSTRQDVLGKTMVRSMKRFYLQQFLDSNDFKTFSQKQKKEQFFTLVQDFVKENFIATGKADQAKKFNISVDDLVFYIGMMVSTAHIKRHLQNPSRKQDQTDFMGVIYSYSTKKMNKLAENAIFQFLFKDFVTNDAFIAADKTLSKHPDLFKRTYMKIIKLWE